MQTRLRRFVKYGFGLAVIFCLVVFVLHTRLWNGEGKNPEDSESRMLHKSEDPRNFHGNGHHDGKKLRLVTPNIGDGKALDRDTNGYRDTVNYNVHAFYYAWYGSPGQDGKYFHWDHEYLPHWIAKISAQYPTGQKHIPPDDIGASFYPLLGPYSSLDESVTRAHLLQMQKAGIGVLALSWYPPGQSDDHGKPIEWYVPTIFDIADEYNIKVCFHIEPYKDRTAATIRENIKYILNNYGQHSAFYRHSNPGSSTELPLMYIYDSYLVEKEEWQKLLTKSGDITIRGTDLDAILIGLFVEGKHMNELASAGFDGIYTYFATDGFSYGSKRRNWHDIARSAQHNQLIFIPSVGPGYDDTRVRPWNTVNSRQRRDGNYYQEGWEKAFKLPGVDTVSITSFNEWHEGTQIESAAHESKQGSFSYLTYAPHSPDFYLELTKTWSMKLLHRQSR